MEVEPTKLSRLKKAMVCLVGFLACQLDDTGSECSQMMRVLLADSYMTKWSDD